MTASPAAAALDHGSARLLLFSLRPSARGNHGFQCLLSQAVPTYPSSARDPMPAPVYQIGLKRTWAGRPAMDMPQACAGLGAVSRPVPGFGAAPGETSGRIGNVRLATDPDRLGGSQGGPA